MRRFVAGRAKYGNVGENQRISTKVNSYYETTFQMQDVPVPQRRPNMHAVSFGLHSPKNAAEDFLKRCVATISSSAGPRKPFFTTYYETRTCNFFRNVQLRRKGRLISRSKSASLGCDCWLSAVRAN